MKNRIIVSVVFLLTLVGVTNISGQVIYEDDFEAYDVEYSSDFSIDGVPTGNWTASNSSANGSCIFQTGNFGGTRLWVCWIDGTILTSKGIEVADNSSYTFSAVLVSETFDGTRQLNVTYDLLIGADPGSATSIIGGPIAVVTHGDNWQIDNSKEDHIFTHDFSTGTLDPGDKLFIVITRVGTHAGSPPWFGVDDVQIYSLEPVEIVESDYHTEVNEGDFSEDSYDVYVKGEPSYTVEVTVTADNQVLVNGQPQVVLTFIPPVDPNIPQSVTVTAIDDNEVEGYHTGTITHISGCIDPNWDNLDLPDVYVSITDNDLPFNYVSDVFVGGQEGPQGTSNYRIPGMIVAPDGSVLAFAEGRRSNSDPGVAGYPIDMVMKRSTDGGWSWGPLVVLHSDPAFDYSDPRPIADVNSGAVHLLYIQWPDDCGQTCVPPGLGDNSSVVFLQTSNDNGQTWSGPININSQVKDPSWSALNCGPGHGIQLRWQTDPARNGRLLAPGHYNSWTGVSIYSDDGGISWQSGIPLSGTNLNESEVVELTNEDLLWDSRQSSGSYRRQCISHDGGHSWEYIGTGDITITAVDCSMVRYSAKRAGHDRNRILFSGPLGDPPGSGSGRYNMAVWTSYDEGQTFINPVQLDNGHGAYSVLQRLQDGTIGLLYEETGSTWIRYINCSITHLEGADHHSSMTHYDGFSNPIDRSRGGVGWSGSWSGDATFTGELAPEFGGSSISFEGFRFPMQNGRLDLVEGGVEGQSAWRSLATPIDMDINSNTYISLLVSQALDTSADDVAGEYLEIALRDSNEVTHVSFGVESNEAFYIGELGDTVMTSADALAREGKYFLVVKIMAQDNYPGGNFDQIFLKVFESGVDEIPMHDNNLNWTLVGTTNENSSALIDRIYLEGGNLATFSIDELRIGTSFEGVVSNSCTTFLVGDLNKDCYVDMLDLALLALDWLEYADPFIPADLNQDCNVDLSDLAVLAGDWLKCTNPFDPSCDVRK